MSDIMRHNDIMSFVLTEWQENSSRSSKCEAEIEIVNLSRPRLNIDDLRIAAKTYLRRIDENDQY